MCRVTPPRPPKKRKQKHTIKNFTKFPKQLLELTAWFITFKPIYTVNVSNILTFTRFHIKIQLGPFLFVESGKVKRAAVYFEHSKRCPLQKRSVMRAGTYIIVVFRSSCRRKR